MISTRMWWPAVALLVMLPNLAATAQTVQFLPEVDVYTGLSPHARFWFQAKETREDGFPTQAEIGPSIDFMVKPLTKLKSPTVFDLDPSKKRLLVLSVGYRYLPSPDSPTINRVLLMATSNFPLKGGILVSDRNRLEINFASGDAYWRYRNRPTLQKTIAVRSYHPSLYASAEVYYTSRYGKWSSTDVYAGCILPLGQTVALNPYYEHENNTGKSPNQQINALGLVLNVFFRRDKN
jgi:uncharacterized protein DUF2490